MRNRQTCRVVGVEDVKIKIYDRCERVLITVRHVPRFKRNLISPSILDWYVCKYKILVES